MSNGSGGSSPWLWVGLGCGALALVGLCVAGGAAYFMFAARSVAPEPPPVPDPWVAPGPVPAVQH